MAYKSWDKRSGKCDLDRVGFIPEVGGSRLAAPGVRVSSEVPASGGSVSTMGTSVDLVAEAKDTIAMVERKRVTSGVGDPELELLVRRSSIATGVLDLAAAESPRKSIADLSEDVVGLDLVGSPGLSTAVAASLNASDGSGDDSKEGRSELHVESAAVRLGGRDRKSVV